MVDNSLALNIIEYMPKSIYAIRKQKKSKVGRKPGPAGKLVPITVFVTQARRERMVERYLLTRQTPSQQAADALDVADPLPPKETGQ